MDYKKLECFSYTQLKDIAENMGLKIYRSKTKLISEITEAFKEYEKYKKQKLDKYIKISQIGNKGKEGITFLVTTKKGQEYAMKTFRKHKSSSTLQKEAELQKMAADYGISPNVIDIDTVSKYIVMDKLDTHLYDVLVKQNGILTRTQQKQIIDIYVNLDKAKVFHGDSNLLNYMYKDKKLYIIDFGMAKEITDNLKKKLSTDTPNLTLMTLGFIMKLKELKCNPDSYKYMIKHLTEEQRKFLE